MTSYIIQTNSELAELKETNSLSACQVAEFLRCGYCWGKEKAWQQWQPEPYALWRSTDPLPDWLSKLFVKMSSSPAKSAVYQFDLSQKLVRGGKKRVDFHLLGIWGIIGSSEHMQDICWNM